MMLLLVLFGMKVIYPQVPVKLSKEFFEQQLWELAAAKIRHHHGDNGTFNVELIDKD